MVARLEAGERTLTWTDAMKLLDLYGAPIQALDPSVPFQVRWTKRRRVPSRARVSSGRGEADAGAS